MKKAELIIACIAVGVVRSEEHFEATNVKTLKELLESFKAMSEEEKAEANKLAAEEFAAEHAEIAEAKAKAEAEAKAKAEAEAKAKAEAEAKANGGAKGTKVESLFASYPDAIKAFETPDGTLFLNENAAKNHHRSLDSKKEIKIYIRD
jgi:membrane protein involved in colicin uptake